VDASRGDDEPEIFDSVHMEGTLWDFGVKVSLAQALEHVMNMVMMLLKGVGENEDIIKIHDDEEIDHVLKWVIQKVLELHWSVCHAHWHDEPLIGAILGVKGCESLMTFSDLNVVVAITKVDFSINRGTMKAIKELIDEGERVVDLLHNLIECMIVNTQVEPAILFFFFCEQDWHACRGGGGTDEPFGEEFVNEFAQCGKFNFQHRIYGSLQYLETFFDVEF
jgi:hypothetical protein